MLACWVSPLTRTSVIVTKPSRGSLIRRLSSSATVTLMRSAILRIRGLVMRPPVLQGPHRSSRPPWWAARPVMKGGSPGGSAARDLPHLERLDDVADPDVLVVPEHQTAFEALADLGDVVPLP